MQTGATPVLRVSVPATQPWRPPRTSRPVARTDPGRRRASPGFPRFARTGVRTPPKRAAGGRDDFFHHRCKFAFPERYPLVNDLRGPTDFPPVWAGSGRGWKSFRVPSHTRGRAARRSSDNTKKQNDMKTKVLLGSEWSLNLSAGTWRHACISDAPPHAQAHVHEPADGVLAEL